VAADLVGPDGSVVGVDHSAPMLADLRAKAARGWTLRQTMAHWSVRSYGAQVARETGISEDTVLR